MKVVSHCFIGDFRCKVHFERLIYMLYLSMSSFTDMNIALGVLVQHSMFSYVTLGKWNRCEIAVIQK